MAPVHQLRDAASMLHAAADQLERSPNQEGAAAFNWSGLIALLVQVIPQIIALFSVPTPAPTPTPSPVVPQPRP